MMRRSRGLSAMALMLVMAACTPLDAGLLGTVAPKPVASPGAVNPLLAIGTAQQVRQELVDAQAAKWNADAILVALDGFRIDGTGVNSGSDARWVYTYRSAKAKATASFTASPTGLKGPTTVTGPAATATPIGTVSYDSDQAILRYITIAKAKGLDRFDLSLAVQSGGTPTWQVTAVDAFGKTQEQGSVNASTGTVSVS